MLGIGKQLTAGRGGSELGNFGEIEVKRQVLTLVANREHHVSSLVASALAKLESLAVYLDLGVLSTRHHLNLQVGVLDTNLLVFIEANNGQ